MANIELEKIILRNLLTNDEYMRKVIPFIKREYFRDHYAVTFHQIVKYVDKFNRLPTLEAFKVELDQASNINDEMYGEVAAILTDIFEYKEEDEEWLLNKTEEWCQDKALHNAVMESVDVLAGNHNTLTKNALPDMLSKALAVSFDTNVGHDYFENMEDRYEYYHQDVERIPFDLEYFNRITKDGLPNKTLNIVMAGPGVGKSLLMCHHAASCLVQGRNVLYITMEMAEERIAERIDANLFDLPMDQVEELPRQYFMNRVNKISDKTNGKLIIKEYPTSYAHANHFRALLNELKLKKNFEPDIIFIDYLNICASARIKMGGSVGSYNYIKSVAEEIRGLAVEFDVPIFSATQINRTGFVSSDPGMEDTSESFGLPATADFMIVAVSSEELEENGQLMFIQLKNRYRDYTVDKRFVVGVDKSKMKLYDVENGGGSGGSPDNGPVFDNSNVGNRVSGERYERLSEISG